MNRVFIYLTSAAALPLLADASVKAVALLAVASACAFLMRRSSAAARHMVWLAAVVALLLVPVLAVMLPGWRVLPQWAAVEGHDGKNEMNGNDAPAALPPSAAPALPAALPAPPLPATETPAPATAAPPHSSHPSPSSHTSYTSPTAPSPAPLPLTSWLLPLWLTGCALLLLRLAAAHFLLRRNARRCAPAPGPLTAAFAAAQQESGVRRPVRLLLDNARSIPVVWGLIRPTLLLPAEANAWDAAQLRSVLLHELAHLRRRDPLVQFLTQIACALHWFNPLVWLAAWRLHVERERACDDMVLSSGVRPSTYAEHLLHIATQLSPACWTHACGLAMARKSSLEGRLLAVLSDKLNRRRLTRALTAAAILLSAAIAVPVAMLRAQEEKPPQKKSDASKPANLTPATEAQLDWGEPVNGLRGAIIIRAETPNAEPRVFLAVQNVSDNPLRFADNTGAKDLRKLYVSDLKGILFALTSSEPTQTDATLQPREVAYLRLLDPVASGDKSVEPALIEGIRKDSLQTWRAVLNIQNAPEGAWKGKLTTGETRGAIRTDSPQPKDPKAQALFKIWLDNARLNGDIPGGLVRLLHDKVKEFIRNNEPDASGGPYAQKMKPLEPRFDVAGDWKPAEVVALLDDIAAAHTIPLETTREHMERTTLQRGQPLPAAYADADWGEPLEGGLRMAFVLEPRAAEYHLGTEVKARIVLHNSGKEPAIFVTTGFQQPGHKARLADGGELKLDSTFWTTLGRQEAYRLHPGEYCEVYTPGLGIGAHDKDRDDWANVRAGSWILCDAGDEVIFSPGAALLARRDEQPDSDDWWLEFITERLNREAPVPLDTKEREHLLYRVVRDLFGTAPSTTEGDAFNADKSPDALQNLAKLLTKHAYGTPCHGTIRAGETKFRVLPPDPDAANRPRVAMHPGWYSLSDSVKFSVTRRSQGQRVINEASIIYFQQGKDNAVTKVELPDGYYTWVAATKKGATDLWVSEKGLLRRFDFADPAAIKETRYKADEAAGAPIPAELREAMRIALSVPGAPAQIEQPKAPAADEPAAPATEKPDKTGDAGTPAPLSENPSGIAHMVQPPGKMSEAFAAHCLKVALARQMAQWKPDDVIAWGEEEDGLRSGVVMERKAVRGTPLGTWFLIRNVSGATKEFTASPVPNRIEARARTADGKLLTLRKVHLLGVDPSYKIVLRPGETLEFEGVPVVFGLEKNADGTTETPKWPTCGFETGAAKVFVSFPLNNVHVPATGEMEVVITAENAAAEKPKSAATGIAPGDMAMIFIPRIGPKRPLPVIDAGDGVTLAIREEVFHGADVMTTVRIRYTEPDGTVTGHDVNIASDAFGNREPWAIAWVRGTKTFWHVQGEFDSKRLRLYRTDFGDPKRIVTAYDGNYEGEPLDALGIPAEVQAKFYEYFGVVDPKPFDKSNGLPDVAGDYVAAARPLSPDGSAPMPQGNSASRESRRWKVQFVDAATGNPVMSLRAKVISRNTDGTLTTYVSSIVTDGTFERNLGGDEYAWVVIEDENLTNAEEGTRLFGNIPAIVSADEKQTNPDLPFIVKVKAREKGAAVKLTPESLMGFWRGKEDNRSLMISFHRPPAKHNMQCDIYIGDATIGVPASFEIAADGASVTLMRHSAEGRVFFGKLVPRADGTLTIVESDRPDAEGGFAGMVLTRDAVEPATQPAQAAARELFEMWKLTANMGGKIPGTFIGKLAGHVREYAKAHPTLHSGMELPKLLPRFVTSRDWTEAEVIQLLDDVAYYSTAPIEALVAANQLPSSPLWRTDVAFEDIPVRIEKWSEPLRGLRIGMRIAGGEWRIGGGVRVELWLHNAGAKDLTFTTTGPDRSDAGLSASATGGDGTEHPAVAGSFRLIAPQLECVLAAGHVAMVKGFDLPFSEGVSENEPRRAPAFIGLKPGKYKLRCTWLDAAGLYEGTEWKGTLATPELEFTLAGNESAAPAPTGAQNPPAAASDHVTVTLRAEGRIDYERQPVTLAELRAAAAKDAKKWFTIRANDAVPYAKVVELIDILKAAGVTEVSLSEARMGDGKYRAANRTGIYKFDAAHRFSICKPRDRAHWFTVGWPAKDGEPARRLRVFPNNSEQTRGQFAVVWEPGTNVLWWVDDTDIGRMDITDPNRVVVTREGRTNNFSRDFALPDEVKAQFRLMGFTVGRRDDALPGGNSGSQQILEAETVQAGSAADADDGMEKSGAAGADDGYAPAGVPVTEIPEQDFAWCEEQNGLCIGLKMDGREWRTGGAVKVELWLRNSGENDVKFHHSARNDIGLRVFLKAADGKEHDANIAQFDGYPVFTKRRLKAGHAFKAKAFTLQLAKPEKITTDPWFDLPAGAYTFRCELAIPGTTSTDAAGKTIVPAEGEWSGTIKSTGVAVSLSSPK